MYGAYADRLCNIHVVRHSYLTDKDNNMIKITNEDNMQLMARYEDNYFDLAIVDPPYGINADKKTTVKTVVLTKN